MLNMEQLRTELEARRDSLTALRRDLHAQTAQALAVVPVSLPPFGQLRIIKE